ncbi:Hypothetical predicted protein [Podarcis lilfordi]|uniref:Uncharacterized protein n=1 Tax=Podarcis lilfordi TaxID=74358 RepID=A0AA35KY47_9SAUR|nr:Hypothetical predicted protein [Podarcis lilfordi]
MSSRDNIGSCQSPCASHRYKQMCPCNAPLNLNHSQALLSLHIIRSIIQRGRRMASFVPHSYLATSQRQKAYYVYVLQILGPRSLQDWLFINLEQQHMEIVYGSLVSTNTCEPSSCLVSATALTPLQIDNQNNKKNLGIRGRGKKHGSHSLPHMREIKDVKPSNILQYLSTIMHFLVPCAAFNMEVQDSML